jgi:hypothetical protein
MTQEPPHEVSLLPTVVVPGHGFPHFSLALNVSCNIYHISLITQSLSGRSFALKDFICTLECNKSTSKSVDLVCGFAISGIKSFGANVGTRIARSSATRKNRIVRSQCTNQILFDEMIRTSRAYSAACQGMGIPAKKIERRNLRKRLGQRTCQFSKIIQFLSQRLLPVT